MAVTPSPLSPSTLHRPYVEHMQSGRNGFQSVTLSISDGFEYSYYEGPRG